MTQIPARSSNTNDVSSAALAQRILKTHERLSSSPLYLASPSFRENVEWQRFGRADILVEKTPSDSLTAPPSHLNPDDAPSDCTPAVLSTVFQITFDDFFLTSDGGYRGPTRYQRSLSDVKPSCTGSVPALDPFRTDFMRAIDNVRWVQNEVATPTFELKRGFLVERPRQPAKLKVRHVLFEPREDSETSNTAAVSSTSGGEGPTQRLLALPPEWSIDKWPVFSDAAREELAEIRSSGVLDVVPLPAYDVDGNLIRPQHYRDALLGATVEVHFTLTHWTISARAGEEPADVYAADIQYIRVLVPPSRLPIVPRKSRILLRDPTSDH